MGNKSKNRQMYYIKQKSSCTAKETMRMKRQHTEWESFHSSPNKQEDSINQNQTL
jgi:hypothetical protein